MKATPQRKVLSTSFPLTEYTLLREISARAAKVDFLWKQEDVHNITFSKIRYDFAYNVTVPIGSERDLGFNTFQDPEKKIVQITACCKNTSASKIPRWRSTVRFKYIRSIDNKPMQSKEDFIETVKEIQESGKKFCEMELMTDESDVATMSVDGTPQIDFDQLYTIYHHLKDLTLKPEQEKLEHDGHQSLSMDQVHYLHGVLEDIQPTTKSYLQARAHKAAVNKLQRSDLMKSGDWHEWENMNGNSSINIMSRICLVNHVHANTEKVYLT